MNDELNQLSEEQKLFVFFAIVKRKVKLLQKSLNFISSITTADQKSVVFEKNQSIALIVHQRQHQIVQNLKN